MALDSLEFVLSSLLVWEQVLKIRLLTDVAVDAPAMRSEGRKSDSSIGVSSCFRCHTTREFSVLSSELVYSLARVKLNIKYL
jgi:hypothetical protein